MESSWSVTRGTSRLFQEMFGRIIQRDCWRDWAPERSRAEFRRLLASSRGTIDSVMPTAFQLFLGKLTATCTRVEHSIPRLRKQ